MRRTLLLALAFGFMVFSFSLFAEEQAGKQKKEKGKFDPPEAFQPNEQELAQIKDKTAQLAARIDELRKNPKTHELLPDVEIYLRGAVNIVRFKEFYSKDSVKWTLAALDRGMERAAQLAKGDAPWTTLGKQNVLRAYRSAIDGTAQPYGVTYPAGYGKDVNRKWRVDIVLHGRNGSLTEVAFLNSHNGNKKVPADQDWVQIDIFGRGNNAYRWSGETDVFEAMDTFFREQTHMGRAIDRRRVVLRGFSMGGAGAWHLGLHHPDKWCVMGPGAGFTTTHDYAWKGKKDLPDYQEKCLRIYDAIDYVENARMIPIVAYSGGDDPQKLAADNIENRLKTLKIDAMTHLVRPNTGHKFEADYFVKANALWAQHAEKGRQTRTKESFVTYTTKFSWCESVWILQMEKHYERAAVDLDRSGKALTVTTTNVAALGVALTSTNSFEKPSTSVMIDGQKLEVTPTLMTMAFLVREQGKWKPVSILDYQKERLQHPRKTPGLQGPIDDAFASGFVCVQGTGTTWHPQTQKFVDAKLKAFEYDWAKHWRGELPLTNEYGISPNEIREKNLILFGDPNSNFLLANILEKLPLKWTKGEIEFAGQKYKSSEHVPVMIFPNPLNPLKYVVLNTGHTFPSEDYAKTNALLYPRLGDYAIVRMSGKGAGYEVATAGLFDEFWRVSKK